MNQFMSIEKSEPQVYPDPQTEEDEQGMALYMNLLWSAKRSLQKYTPKRAKDAYIDDDKLITEVLERNRQGQKKLIKKIVCPFCFTSVAPQNRTGTKRWDVTNFNRHLMNIHGRRAK